MELPKIEPINTNEDQELQEENELDKVLEELINREKGLTPRTEEDYI